MNNEIKRQLILSGILLCMLVSTLFLWYDNFMFHTYVNVADYQYCFAGENDSVLIDGYEFYKNDRIQKNGKARVMALEDRFFLKGDLVRTTFVVNTSKEEYRYEQETKMKTDNEVFTLEEVETTKQLYDDDFADVMMHMTIIRNNKTVYDEDIVMKNQVMTVFNGGNKEYAIRNVYATPSWLKTGDFSCSVKDIDKKYPNITIDYMYLKDNGQVDDINDYERFAYVKGKTADILKGNDKQVAYYDEQDSLLGRTLSCVVTLTQDDSQAQPYTFMIQLQGTIKVVDSNG